MKTTTSDLLHTLAERCGDYRQATVRMRYVPLSKKEPLVRGVVLGELDSKKEFVVWNIYGGNMTSTSNGDYFSYGYTGSREESYKDAKKRFLERVKGCAGFKKSDLSGWGRGLLSITRHI